MKTDELQRSWHFLETSVPEQPELRVRGLGARNDRGEFLVGVDVFGDRHLLIPMPPASKIRTDLKSAGVQVGRRKLDEAGAKRTFVDVSCTKTHLFDHFDVIAAEILTELESPGDRPDIVAIRVLEKWRELLAREPSQTPSLSKLLGLFGELSALLRLAEHHGDAVSWWLGPDGGRHDFVTPFGALEIKTTRSTDDWAVQIHGVDQLSPPATGDLCLEVLKVEPHPDGAAILDVVEKIVNAGVDHGSLTLKLKTLGIDEKGLASLSAHRFTIRESRVYRVTHDFPRIVPESFANAQVPGGVRGLQYTIDLTAEPPAPMSEEETVLVLKELAGADL